MLAHLERILMALPLLCALTAGQEIYVIDAQNDTANPAARLSMTIAEAGGGEVALIPPSNPPVPLEPVLPEGAVISPSFCNMLPNISVIDVPIGSEVLIDWVQDCIQPGDSIRCFLSTVNGSLAAVSGTWLDSAGQPLGSATLSQAPLAPAAQQTTLPVRLGVAQAGGGPLVLSHVADLQVTTGTAFGEVTPNLALAEFVFRDEFKNLDKNYDFRWVNIITAAYGNWTPQRSISIPPPASVDWPAFPTIDPQPGQGGRGFPGDDEIWYWNDVSEWDDPAYHVSSLDPAGTPIHVETDRSVFSDLPFLSPGPGSTLLFQTFLVVEDVNAGDGGPLDEDRFCPVFGFAWFWKGGNPPVPGNDTNGATGYLGEIPLPLDTALINTSIVNDPGGPAFGGWMALPESSCPFETPDFDNAVDLEQPANAGLPVAFTVTAFDFDPLEPVTLSVTSQLPPGATLAQLSSSGAPTNLGTSFTGNGEVRVLFNWTPDPCDPPGVIPLDFMVTNSRGGVAMRTYEIQVGLSFIIAGTQPGHIAFGNTGDVLLTAPAFQTMIPFASWDPAGVPMVAAIPDDASLMGLPLYLQLGVWNQHLFPGDPVKMSNGVEVLLGMTWSSYGTGSGLTLTLDDPPLLGGVIDLRYTMPALSGN